MTSNFKVVAPGAHEIDVFGWRRKQLAARVSVRLQRRGPADIQPVVGLRLAVEKVEDHLFLIAQEGHEPASLTKQKQVIEHATAVWTAVDTVTKDHQRVVAPE